MSAHVCVEEREPSTRNRMRRRYELLQSPDNRWMIFSSRTGVPVMVGSVPLIGLSSPLCNAVLRILTESSTEY